MWVIVLQQPVYLLDGLTRLVCKSLIERVHHVSLLPGYFNRSLVQCGSRLTTQLEERLGQTHLTGIHLPPLPFLSLFSTVKGFHLCDAAVHSFKSLFMHIVTFTMFGRATEANVFVDKSSIMFFFFDCCHSDGPRTSMSTQPLRQNVPCCCSSNEQDTTIGLYNDCLSEQLELSYRIARVLLRGKEATDAVTTW